VGRQVRSVALLDFTIDTKPGKYGCDPRLEIRPGVPVSLCGATRETIHHALYLWANPQKGSIGSLENL
jgi:hypothetical protein